ncbi:unnamed protein product [Prorocentrum cordatum]|uniref:Uncharacterized protein n=1 Tax=Prorocentrum cordatum TaxID=2364126 RepID=A0ABN9P933_9DINO|nr:unnamed protein product [Polarella glacialis]
MDGDHVGSCGGAVAPPCEQAEQVKHVISAAVPVGSDKGDFVGVGVDAYTSRVIFLTVLMVFSLVSSSLLFRVPQCPLLHCIEFCLSQSFSRGLVPHGMPGRAYQGRGGQWS